MPYDVVPTTRCAAVFARRLRAEARQLANAGIDVHAVTSGGPSVERAPTRPDDLGLIVLTELADDWDDYIDQDGRAGMWFMLMV